MRQSGPKVMTEDSRSQASGMWNMIQERQQHWLPRAALMTCYLTILRAKISQALFLTSLHYCTTASSSFRSHDQLSDLFYILSSNYLEENSLSMPSGTMISTECPFLPPRPTGPCPASACAVWGQAKARAEWPLHWEALVNHGDRNS